MKHWYALYTKPHQEQHVELWLRQEGIETYLPTVQRKRFRRDRPRRVVYFPCYLFARLDLEVKPQSSIAWMPGVRHIVSAGGEPVIVGDDLIALIQRRLGSIEQVGYGDLHQGDLVRVTAGPLRDLEAVFDRPSPTANRVHILLDVMGRMASVEIERSQIKRIR
jgi:transcription elongation factor/antiterminator RfaH